MLSWRDIDTLHVEDAFGHWQAAERLGLDCPLDVFEQLFHERGVIIPSAAASIDWLRVRWSEERLSGAELRGVTVDRFFQRAVDEARAVTVEAGLYDDRPEVIAAWRQEHTWIVPPVLLRGEVTGATHRYALLAGNTRLGNLLGLMDRQEVGESQRHRVWLGALLPP